jgi:exodeoxyribonuclease V alpha subunit
MQELAIRAVPVQVRCEFDDYQVVVYETEAGELTAVGSLLCTEGECVLHGNFSQHKKYGKQFQVTYCEEVLPTTSEGMKRYLVSSGIAEIGSATADRIVDTFGAETFQAMRDPVRLVTVQGISETKAEKIVASFKKCQELQEYVQFLADYRIPSGKTKEVYQKFSGIPDALSVLQSRPYLLCMCEGITFAMIDAVQKQREGFDPVHGDRICFALSAVMQQNEQNGHVFMEKEALFEKTGNLLRIPGCDRSVFFPYMQAGLVYLVKNQTLIYDCGVLYRKPMYLAESESAEKLLRLLWDGQKQKLTKDKIDAALVEAEKWQKLALSQEQKNAVSYALTETVSIITGGPGTGKTSLLQVLICAEEMLHPEGKLTLCAPTGRAARKMAESTGKVAVTMHHLLEIRQEEQEREEEEELKLSTDLVIVDECSMVSMQLLYALLKALDKGTRLVLIGDCDQLPSVQAGNVFADMIGSQVFPVTYLTKTFRQKQGSAILTNASCVNRGRGRFLWNTDCMLCQTWQEEDTLDGLLQVIRALQKQGISSKAMQVLTPFRSKTKLGCIQLNRMLQELMNPKTAGTVELLVGSRCFRKGDKVMHLENEEDVSNGDVGYITEINQTERKLTVLYETGVERTYTSEEFSMLELAYALTVHKAQGSEYDCVILPFTKIFGRMRQKNLLYTAMTRARKKLVIVGNEETLWYASGNRIERRNSYLGFRLMDGNRMRKVAHNKRKSKLKTVI